MQISFATLLICTAAVRIATAIVEIGGNVWQFYTSSTTTPGGLVGSGVSKHGLGLDIAAWVQLFI